MHHFLSRQLQKFAPLVLLTFGLSVSASTVILPLPAHAASSIPDISGAWSSPYGVLTLRMDGKDQDGNVVVSGTWNNAGTINQIVYGRFEPATAGGTLKFEYYLPAKTLYGYAEFKLDASQTTFKGKYFETGQDGDWIMTRKKGYKPSTLADLQVAANAGKRMDKLTNVAGKWNSSFGLVELTGVGMGGQTMVFKGTFTRGDGKVGKIPSATFTRPNGGFLKLEYQAPWNNRNGTAEFKPDKYVGGRQMLGVYNEDGNTGVWILSRPPG